MTWFFQQGGEKKTLTAICNKIILNNSFFITIGQFSDATNIYLTKKKNLFIIKMFKTIVLHHIFVETDTPFFFLQDSSPSITLKKTVFI